MIINDNNAKPKAFRRSSLKSKNLNIKPNPNPNSSVKKNGKRTSISWGQIDTFEFKEMKPTFQENEEIVKKQTEESDERHKKFIENRRRSIKNEFVSDKQIIKMSENLINEIFDEEMKIYDGGDDKEENNSLKEKNSSRESSKSKSKSRSGSGSCSCSRGSRSCSCSSCSSCRKSDKENEKVKKDKKDKKNKKEKQSDKDKDSQKSDCKREKDKKLKLKDKKEKKDADNQKNEDKKTKDKILKLKEKKEETKDEKIDEKISIKKYVESPKEINKQNKPKKEEEKVTNIRVKLISDSDAKVRLISYKEARELNLDTVAYIVLNDGTVLVVRREYKNKNQNSFCDNPINYSYNNLSYFSNGAMNPNYSNFTNNNNFSRPNIDNQMIELPFKKMPFKHLSQNFYPKENYTFNKPMYGNNYPYFQVKSFNNNLTKNYINKNNIKLSKNPNSPLLKNNKIAQSFKYFSSKINLKSSNLKSNHSQSQSNLLSNIPKKFLQISPQRFKEIDNFRVIEAIPVDNNNSQILSNPQANGEVTDSNIYTNKVVTNFSRYNKYRNKRKPNMVYSQMNFNDGENNYNYTDMN